MHKGPPLKVDLMPASPLFNEARKEQANQPLKQAFLACIQPPCPCIEELREKAPPRKLPDVSPKDADVDASLSVTFPPDISMLPSVQSAPPGNQETN